MQNYFDQGYFRQVARQENYLSRPSFISQFIELVKKTVDVSNLEIHHVPEASKIIAGGGEWLVGVASLPKKS